MSEALVIQHVERGCCIVISGLSGCATFSHVISNGAILGTRLTSDACVDSLYKSGRFLILKRI